MEIQGIRVDKERLVEMGVEFEARLKEIEQEIYELAGEEFNINSTKQLGVILFERWAYQLSRRRRLAIQQQ